MQEAQAASRGVPHSIFRQHKAYGGKHVRTKKDGAPVALAAYQPKRMRRSKKAACAMLTGAGVALCIIFAPLLAVNVTLLAKSALSDGVPSFASFVPLVVVSDSMAPVIEGGDLIVCDVCDGESVSEGNIICFLDPRSDQDALVVHRAIEKTTKNGTLAWRTQGDANNTADTAVVPASNVIGTYNGMRVPGLGSVILAMQTPVGVMVCVGVPLVGIGLWEAVRNRRRARANAGAPRGNGAGAHAAPAGSVAIGVPAARAARTAARAAVPAEPAGPARRAKLAMPAAQAELAKPAEPATPAALAPQAGLATSSLPVMPAAQAG